MRAKIIAIIILASLLLVAGAVLVIHELVPYLLLRVMFGPDEDNFGKDIVIPPDMKLEDPLHEKVPEGERAQDPEGVALFESFRKPVPSEEGAEGSESITVGCGFLERFSGPSRDLLLRHLATSARWRLTEEQGKIYAHRRFVVGGIWQANLNGFYIYHDLNPMSDFPRGWDQFRLILGPDGPVFAQPWSQRQLLTEIPAGTIDGILRTVDDKDYGQGKESYLLVGSSSGALEIFEQSNWFARRATPLALRQVEEEFNAVLGSVAAREKGVDAALMPRESMREGSPELHLRLWSQGGMYQVYAYLNPGEAGKVYLKAFEATRNTPLSVDRIGPRSTEYTGWSSDFNQQFFYNTEITVYEGDWGTFYPARFEIWFVPAKGGGERKLLEKLFRIQGWQR